MTTLKIEPDTDMEGEGIEDGDEIKPDKPFKGLTSALKKIKNMEELSRLEKEALKNFLDEFTTVSTNEDTVGELVSRMVLEVNIHSHTKSCRKYDCLCRFFYPKFPSVRTIIAEPISGTDSEDKTERLKKYEETLIKFKDILNYADIIDKIIGEIGTSEKEPKTVYKGKKVRRIEALLEKAGVTIHEYEEALSFTKLGTR